METANGLSPELPPSDAAPDLKSLPAVGQIFGLHRDGRLDIMWMDGIRSATYLHQLYAIADDVGLVVASLFSHLSALFIIC